MTENATSTSVLVVGAGPVGLTMAINLARQGVDVRIIDRCLTRSQFSKALALHARTLEVLENMGCLDKALAGGRNVYGTNAYYQGKRLVHLTFDELVAPYPFVLMLPQSDTERILEEHLQSLSVTVERGLELTSFKQEGRRVTASVSNLKDGSASELSARYLVACDGAHSTCRHLLNLPFEGAPYEELFGAADVRVDCDLPEDEVHAFLSEEGVVAFFPFGNSRFRVILSCEPGAVEEGNEELSYFQALIDRRLPGRFLIADPHWLTWFRIHRRMVEQYRHGLVFLAGDAAHIHSPIGGVGMNTGMQDAYNLAWKLALVLAGAADDSLLDSYHAERHPIARSVLHGTDLATKFATIRHPVGQQVRNSLVTFLSSLEVVQERIMRNTSLIAVNYRRSPIVGEHRGGLAAVHLIGPDPGEKPSFGDWLDFGKGPLPGDRAPDGVLIDGKSGLTVRIFDALRGTGHNLLLFDGRPTDSGYRNLEDIAKSVRDQYGRYIRPQIIVAAESRPQSLDWDGDLWLDPDLAAHEVFGAGSECLYLIRPDGYVGFRSQPADMANLQEYLGRIFS